MPSGHVSRAAFRVGGFEQQHWKLLDHAVNSYMYIKDIPYKQSYFFVSKCCYPDFPYYCYYYHGSNDIYHIIDDHNNCLYYYRSEYNYNYYHNEFHTNNH